MEGYYHKNAVQDLIMDYLRTTNGAKLIFCNFVGPDGIIKAMNLKSHLETTEEISQS